MVSVSSKAKPRSGMYMWVTWVAALLAGNGSCEWSAQFKSHFQGYDQVKDGFNFAGWTIDHTSMLHRRRVELENVGSLVKIEDQNKFTLRGSTGILAGKPDIVAFPDPDNFALGVVEDVKTGNPRPSDVAQVLLYMLALPEYFVEYRSTTFSGRLVYKDSSLEIPPYQLDAVFLANFTDLWARLAASAEAVKVPSVHECRFCKLTSADCSERIVEAPDQVTTDLF